MQPDFFPKLLDLFNMSEDLENVDDLHMIFRLVKGISKFVYPLVYLGFLICFSFAFPFFTIL